MKKPVVVCMMGVALLAASSTVFAQDPQDPQVTISIKDFSRPGAELPEAVPGPGWKACPRCQNPGQEAAARKKFEAAGQPFNPKDLSGIWGNDGIRFEYDKMPAMTPEGRRLWEATQADKNSREPDGATNGGPGSKDPMLKCDPLGYPRLATYHYGTEFVQAPDRVFQFFEWGHTWRTIWTDGRPLPTAPSENRFLGYSVGHWDGNTFVIESYGFEPLTWLDEDRRTPRMLTHGLPHSDKMRLTERWTRTSPTTVDIEFTIVDPVVFVGPWTSHATEKLHPYTEIGEYFCVPSFSDYYNKELIGIPGK